MSLFFASDDSQTARDDFWLRLFVLYEVWRQRARQRRALRRLDAHALHDLALSAADVEREAGKPFWRT